MGQESFFVHIHPQPSPFGANIDVEVTVQQLLAEVEVQRLAAELEQEAVATDAGHDETIVEIEQQQVESEKCNKC